MGKKADPKLRSTSSCFLTAAFCRGVLPQQLDAAAHRLPGVVAARHVARVESCPTQRDRGLTADVETVDAVGHDRLFLGEFADPVVEPLRVAPYRALHDLGRLGGVVAR